jgi:DNA polymerase elongation subunit (family B)
MGYLIGGAGEGPEKELEVSKSSQYENLSDQELLNLHEQTVKSVTKWSNFQMVRKICLNSLYGALGNTYFRYYKLDNAEAITLTGQVAIQVD